MSGPRVGLLARADDRGIGLQSWELYRNLRPHATLVVREPGAERQGFRPHLYRYPDATVVQWDHAEGLPERPVREFLDEVDVVYMVETSYDARLFRWAKQCKARTVVHANPEFWKWQDRREPRPDVWWLPTTWRAGLLPREARVVPVPCPTPPFEPEVRRLDGPAEFVHVVGHRAAADRNGSLIVFQALRRLQVRSTWNVECQDRRLPSFRSSNQVVVRKHLGGRADRWELYKGRHVLVLPRRYGGLCLPVLEAMAAGLAVVMTDVAPQAMEWPIVGVPADYTDTLPTLGGDVALASTDPAVLRRTLDRLAGDPGELFDARSASLAWAKDNDWEHLLPLYEDELARAAG